MPSAPRRPAGRWAVAGPPRRPGRARAAGARRAQRRSTPPPSKTWCSAASTRSAAQAGDIARTCWLAAGLPEHVPGTTVDRQCGSSQQAVHFAAQAVMSGTTDVVVAGGVQQMSQIPISSAMTLAGSRSGSPTRSRARRAGWSATARRRSASSARAEMIAEKWDITRDDMEAFAVESHEPRDPGPRRGPVRAPRSRRSASVDARRRARASPNWEKIRSLPHARRGRSGHRGGGVARSPTRRPRC